jgi:hypothetical protein
MSFTPPPPPAYPPGQPRKTGFLDGRKRVIAVIAGIVVAGGAVFAVTQTTGEDPDDTDTAVSNDSKNEPDPHQSCVDSWNRNNTNKTSIGGIATSAQAGGNPTAYVSVGYSSMFPDRCMMTVANPSTMFAQQYVQDNGDSWGFVPAWTGSASQLDESLTDWNAKMDHAGIITLG